MTLKSTCFFPHVVQIDPEMKCLKTKEAQHQILSTGLFRVMIRLYAGTLVLLTREDVIEMCSYSAKFTKPKCRQLFYFWDT